MIERAEYQKIQNTCSRLLYKAPRTGIPGGLLLFIIALLLSMLLFGNLSLAAGNLSITRTFQPPSADNYMGLKNPDDNNGGATSLYVYAKIDVTNRPILKFDTGIPSGSTVSSANLSLYYYENTKIDPVGRTYWGYRLTETDWVEGTSTGATEAGASDWSHRVHDTLSWTTAGGTYTTDNGSSSTVPASFGWMNWSVANQVQTAPTSTHFLIKDSGETTDSGAFFYSKEEATSTTLRPKLVVTFTAPWESYNDSGRATIDDDFGSGEGWLYMRGTGFATGTYNVAYYDNDGTKVGDDLGVGLTAGNLDTDHDLTSDPSAVAGTWNALVQPSSGYTSFGADNYSAIVAAPDTYGLVANDSFTVQQEAIPELPAVMAGIVVAGLCFGIYYWMRWRRLARC